HEIGGDIDALPIDQHMAVVDELARSEDSRHEFHAIDHRIETTLQEANEVFGGIALKTLGGFIDAAEGFLRDIAVIALQLLLGAQVNAIVGDFAAAALAMLAGPVITAVYRAFRATPKVLAHATVNFVFR